MYDMSSIVNGMVALVYLIIVGALSIPIIIWTLVDVIKFILWLTKKNKFWK